MERPLQFGVWSTCLKWCLGWGRVQLCPWDAIVYHSGQTWFAVSVFTNCRGLKRMSMIHYSTACWIPGPFWLKPLIHRANIAKHFSPRGWKVTMRAFQVTNSIKAKAVGLSQRIQRQLSITSPKSDERLVNRSQNLQNFPWPLTSGFTRDLRDLVPSLSSPASDRAVQPGESKRIVRAKSVNDGKQVDMEFSDGTAFRFHTGWMKDSHPNLVGEDTYRKSAQTILEHDQYTAEMLNVSSDGSLISVHFKNHSNQKGVTEEYSSDWLHAFAPYVGSPLNNSSCMTKGSGLPDTGSLLEDIYKNRKPWDSTLEIPKFSGPELLKDENLQIQFLETMMETGVAMISDIGKPQSFQDVDCGKPLEDFVFSIIGRINQHPVRATRFGVIHSEATVAEHSSDYDCKNPLSMHTDHSHYHGTPGYLQFMYQARGSVTSKVCDGLAVAEYLRQNHPKDFEMLAKVNVTHSIRNSTLTEFRPVSKVWLRQEWSKKVCVFNTFVQTQW